MLKKNSDHSIKETFYCTLNEKRKRILIDTFPHVFNSHFIKCVKIINMYIYDIPKYVPKILKERTNERMK